MATYNSNGLTIDSADEIRTETEDSYKGAFGDDVDLGNESPFKQIIDISTERESLIQLLIQAVNNGAFPNLATGVNLDNAASITGQARLPAAKSTVQQLQLTTTGGSPVNVPAGSLISQSSNSVQWVTLNAVVIPIAGSIITPAETVLTGEFTAAIGSIDTILTAISGLDSLTNLDEAVQGRNEETDSEFRIRRLENLFISQGGTLGAMEARLLDVDGITFVAGRENRTAAIVGGLAPHSFEMTIISSGLTDDQIAQEIFTVKPAGIESNGTESGNAIDSFGTIQVMKWNIATEIDIFFIANLTTDSNYPVTGDQLVKDALVAFGNALSTGDDVINWRAKCALEDIPGIVGNIVLFQGTSAAPTTENDISIAINEVANITDANITVNS